MSRRYTSCSTATTDYPAKIPVPNCENFLYLGSIQATKDHIISELEINAILNASETKNESQERKFTSSRYRRFIFEDSITQSLKVIIPRAVKYIKDKLAQGSLLVHCAMGKSRSVSLVIAYFIIEHGFNFEDALEYVRQFRPIANPNCGFARQLRQLVRNA